MAIPYRYAHFKREVLWRDLVFRSGPAPGQPFPDFDLETVEGKRIRKADFLTTRPVLVTLGSLTCPMTKSAGPVLKELYKEFGERIEFLTLYVREAHPGDRYPQPANFREKLVNARVYRERDRIPWTIAVDDIDGGLHQTLDNKSNAAYVMDSDGKVLFRTLWSNDYAPLHAALLGVVQKTEGREGENTKALIPLIKGMGELYETLRYAGGYAKNDFRKELPLMYGVARMAALFRPLPPLARVFAAAGLVVAVGGISAGMLARSEKKTPC